MPCQEARAAQWSRHAQRGVAWRRAALESGATWRNAVPCGCGAVLCCAVPWSAAPWRVVRWVWHSGRGPRSAVAVAAPGGDTARAYIVTARRFAKRFGAGAAGRGALACARALVVPVGRGVWARAVRCGSAVAGRGSREAEAAARGSMRCTGDAVRCILLKKRVASVDFLAGIPEAWRATVRRGAVPCVGAGACIPRGGSWQGRGGQCLAGRCRPAPSQCTCSTDEVLCSTDEVLRSADEVLRSTDETADAGGRVPVP